MCMASNDLQLLCSALSTQGEAEGDGVKYIWMDDNTVYRFENNRMKKVSKTMLNKANKLIQQQNSIPGSIPGTQPTAAPKKGRKAKAKQQVEPEPQLEEEDTDDMNEPQVEPEPPKPKPKARTRKTTPSPVLPASTIDLNEYWQVKNKNEYMTNEIDRLNHKVSKLKQYKSIVNKLTGGEYDPVIPEPQPSQQSYPQQSQSYPPQPQPMRNVNDSLFMF